MRGSKASRRPSPTKLIARTVSRIAIPGGSQIHKEAFEDVDGLGAVEHVAPGGGGRQHAQSQEGKTGLGQDGTGDAERSGHEQRSKHVRQDMLDHDVAVLHAQAARRHHEIPFAY